MKKGEFDKTPKRKKATARIAAGRAGSSERKFQSFVLKQWNGVEIDPIVMEPLGDNAISIIGPSDLKGSIGRPFLVLQQVKSGLKEEYRMRRSAGYQDDPVLDIANEQVKLPANTILINMEGDISFAITDGPIHCILSSGVIALHLYDDIEAKVFITQLLLAGPEAQTVLSEFLPINGVNNQEQLSNYQGKLFKRFDINVHSLFRNRFSLNYRSYEFIAIFILYLKQGSSKGEFNQSHKGAKTINEFVEFVRKNEKEGYLKVQKDSYGFIHEQKDYLKYVNLDAIPSFIEEFRNDLDFLALFSGELFDYVLQQGALTDGKKGLGFSVIPQNLTKLLIGLADTRGHDVLNPFAGIGQVLTELRNQANYNLGYEENKLSRKIAKVRFKLYDVNPLYEKEDSFTGWLKDEEGDIANMERVIATPPFGKASNKITSDGKQVSAEQSIITNSIEAIGNSGKAVVLCSNGFGYRKGEDKLLREDLVMGGYINAVIQLPSKVLYDTSIPLIVLILQKASSISEPVKFIDASNLYSNEALVRIINYKAIVDLIENGQDNSLVRNVSFQEIIDQDFNLDPGRYFIRETNKKAGGRNVKLKELIQPLDIAKLEVNGPGRLVEEHYLPFNHMNFEVNYDDFDRVTLKGAYRALSESAILIGSRLIGKSLPGYYSGQHNLYLTDTIYAFTVVSNEVDIEFLLYFLSTDHALKTFETLKSGNTELSLKDILNLEVTLPDLPISQSISQQKLMVRMIEQERSSRGEQVRELREERNKLAHGQNRDWASIRHTTRQYLSGLLSNVKGTKRFMLNNAKLGVKLGTLYSKNLDRTLGDHLNFMENLVISMSKLIDDFDSPQLRGDKAPLIPFENLIEKARQELSRPDIFTFNKLIIDVDSFNMDGGQWLSGVRIHEVDFMELISNIVTNAIEHGFINSDRDYRMEMFLSMDSKNEFFELEIRNNGEAAPENFTQEDLVTRGEKSINSKGSGTGGSDIQRIISKYDMVLEWHNQPEHEFPISYIIKVLPGLFGDEELSGFKKPGENEI